MADDNYTRTPAQGVPIFATHTTVEQMQRDQNLMSGRLQKLETLHEAHVDAVNSRLNNGAKTFSEIEQQVKAVNEKVSPRWAAVIPIGLVVGGWIWVAARYPDPTKFETLQEQVQGLQMRQVEVNAELSGMGHTLDSIEKRNARIEDKLDQALRPAPAPVLRTP